jgi:hypothetical protein
MEHNANNINVIAYPSVNYKNEPSGSFMTPYVGLFHGYSEYWNLDRFANIKVKVAPCNEYHIREYQHIKKHRWQEAKERMKEYIKFKQ